MSLQSPWIGPSSVAFRKEIEESVGRGFINTKVRVVFTTNQALTGKVKDVLPDTAKKNIVYEYRCCCGQAYVGKTTQRLSERIHQHVPDSLFQTPPVTRSTRTDSAVTRHLRDSPSCIGNNQDMTGRFRVLAQARSQFQLDVLEALLIKRLSPILCQQKEFVRVLQLF